MAPCDDLNREMYECYQPILELIVETFQDKPVFWCEITHGANYNWKYEGHFVSSELVPDHLLMSAMRWLSAMCWDIHVTTCGVVAFPYHRFGGFKDDDGRPYYEVQIPVCDENPTVHHAIVAAVLHVQGHEK